MPKEKIEKKIEKFKFKIDLLLILMCFLNICNKFLALCTNTSGTEWNVNWKVIEKFVVLLNVIYILRCICNVNKKIQCLKQIKQLIKLN
jgi:hypothetical protein